MQPLPPGDPEVCSQCNADISNADEAPYEVIDLAELEDDTPENREIVAIVEGRSQADPSQDVPLKGMVRKFGGMDVRHSEMLVDREQRRAGYRG